MERGGPPWALMTFLLLCGKWEVETERRLGYKLRNVYISTTAYKDYDSPRLPSAFLSVLLYFELCETGPVRFTRGRTHGKYSVSLHECVNKWTMWARERSRFYPSVVAAGNIFTSARVENQVASAFCWGFCPFKGQKAKCHWIYFLGDTISSWVLK